ncbi:MAG: tetratricopeptide repeat protein [Desulfarculus sp.]|jgi:tetratricopeptide (TPR) repeat protein/ribonuclease BN (tRNA processing enzyme)|nr:MAG: tetratricopeptide repeat protein [Desulfarculus sp.]
MPKKTPTERALYSCAELAFNKNHFKEAQKYARKALSCKRPKILGKTYFLQGKIQVKLGNFEDAITCFKNAKEAGYERPEDCDVNIGSCHLMIDRPWQALESCLAACRNEKYHRLGDAYNQVGLVYMKMGKYSDAIDYFKKALNENTLSNPGIAKINLGEAYSHSGDHKAAGESFKEAKAFFQAANGVPFLQLLERLISKEKQKGKGTDSLKESLIETELLFRVVNRLIRQAVWDEDQQIKIVSLATQVGQILEAKLEAAKEYAIHVVPASDRPPERERLTLSLPPPPPTNYFLSLKAWSSNLPLMSKKDSKLKNIQHIVGGGYFIWWKEKGIVIDPGIDFRNNFHDYNRHLDDIDAIIVTHCHIDHAHDLDAIVDMLRENKSILQSQNKLRVKKQVIIMMDQQTHFAKEDEIAKVVGEDNCFLLKKMYKDSINNKLRDVGIHIKVHPFATQHNCKGSVGLAMEFLNDDSCAETIFKLGITSDTGWTSYLAEELRDCQAIIAHFSKTDKNDIFSYEHPLENTHHLGYRGAHQIIKDTKAQLFILAEWSAEIGDFRFQVAQLLSMEDVGKNKKIIPADLGLLFTLPSVAGEPVTIRCSSCHELVPFSSIIIGNPSNPYGSIVYSCKNCQGK